MRAWARRAVVLALCLAGAVSASAQQQTGTITGTVVDDSGAVVPGVTASATEKATGLLRSAVSNEQGVFRMAALPPGQYALKVELSGFGPVTVTDIALSSSEVRDLGKLALKVGGQTEAITVTAEVTPVQVASSSRSSTVTSDQLTNIQMKGRDIYGLLAVLPGVMDTNMARDFTTWTSMRDITINGAPATNKNVLVDGMSVVDEGGAGNAFVNPNIDAVGEVQVIANGFTAENGRNNGGLINMVTKSGTSRIRGSGWYNGRRDRFNANDYFRKLQGNPKPLYRVNISGYSIGGPVVIPKVMDSRTGVRKMFFFFSQEYTDDARPSVVVRANLPTDLERAGDFSQTRQSSTNLAINGTLQPITDPLTGLQFPGNVIPANRISPMGQKLLNLLPKPNGILNPVAGQEWTSNSAYDQTPLHSRTDHVLRMDQVLTNSMRMSAKYVRDREDNWSDSNIAPGVGHLNNFVPGWLVSGTLTQVLSNTMVNEINTGFGHNNYGFKAADNNYYTDLYRTHVGIDPPRLKPFGAFSDPPVIGYRQQDEYPYLPILTFAGGNRANLAAFNSGMSGGRVMPSANRNDRMSFQDDLSKTKGRHSLKVGVYFELASKTEPGSSNYMGNFSFGSTTTNPLDAGNGYANALLGYYQTYTETSNRVDKDVRHWQNEAYLQDSWKVSPTFTLDYGVRLTHSGASYDINNANAGFFADQYNPAKAPRLYAPICLNAAITGAQTCPTNQRGAIDPLNPSQVLSFAYVGNFVPGTGDPLNGMKAGGRDGKGGDYYTLPYLVAAPRVGFAWDLTGDGKTALRASTGIFYNYPRGGFSFVGNPPVSFNRVIRNASIDDIANFGSSNIQFAETPIGSGIVGDNLDLERSYNANVAFQRDIGFKTVVEVSYVGNFTRNAGRSVNLNSIPLYAYGNVKNLFNGTAISANFLRTTYPGMGSITTQKSDLATLNYNAMQVGVNRRLSQGLQMGLAYTLAKGLGMQGYDEYTDSLGGAGALRARYYGPTVVDRKHNLVINYSYQVPNPTPHVPILNHVLGNWQVSGVTKFLSGTAISPTCSSNNTGIANADPSLTGVAVRCMLTGQPIDSGFTVAPDPSVAVHFNLAAFAMAAPLSPTVGNFGNAGIGLLRNPSWSNWDLTLARRIPVHLGQNGQVRVQLQAYNLFNQVEFTTLNAAYTFTGTNNSVINTTTTGRYTATNPPRQMGITMRIDF